MTCPKLYQRITWSRMETGSVREEETQPKWLATSTLLIGGGCIKGAALGHLFFVVNFKFETSSVIY